MNRAERRAALLRTAAALSLASALDLSLEPTPARLAVWAAWIATYGGAALLVGQAPMVVAYAGALSANFASVLGLLALATQGAGTASPHFLFLIAVPILLALIVPDDLPTAGLTGLVALVGGAWLFRAEGRPWADLARWATGVFVVVGLALAATALHRLRQRRALATEQARSLAVAQLAESERARILAERWATVGLLADGVAHDVNSPLGSLRSNLAFAREELGAGRVAEVDEALSDAQEGVERIREIVASLRAFSLAEREALEHQALAEQPVAAAAPTPPPTPASAPAAVTPGEGTPEMRRAR